VAFACDAYDDWIADLDEQVGRLIDGLERRGIHERSWLIVTSDHGESFGVPHHDFGHGTSLDQPQLHVPLVIVPPAAGRPGRRGPVRRVVPETVSLRDLPATVVDLLDLEAGAPLLGTSLAGLWDRPDSGGAADPAASRTSPAPSEVVPTKTPAPPSESLLQERSGWGSLAEGDSVHVRASYRGQAHEELFDLHADPRDLLNLANEAAQQLLLERMRPTLDGSVDRRAAHPPTISAMRPRDAVIRTRPDRLTAERAEDRS
jgi:arylsulfatase A-like enzyme